MWCIGQPNCWNVLYLKSSLHHFSEIVDEIKNRMVREVDFIEEAQNLDDFIQYLNVSGNQAATAPKVYHQFSTRRVLTMQRLYGCH